MLLSFLILLYVHMLYLSSGLMIPWWRNCCSAICHLSASLNCMGGAALNRRSPKNPGPLFWVRQQVTIWRRLLGISYLSSLLRPHEIFLDAFINFFTNHFSLDQYIDHMMLIAPPLSLLESCYIETHGYQVDISLLIVHRTSGCLHRHHQDIYTSESESSGTSLNFPVQMNCNKYHFIHNGFFVHVLEWCAYMGHIVCSMCTVCVWYAYQAHTHHTMCIHTRHVYTHMRAMVYISWHTVTHTHFVAKLSIKTTSGLWLLPECCPPSWLHQKYRPLIPHPSPNLLLLSPDPVDVDW